MTTPMHAITSIAVMLIFTTNIYLLILAALLGIIPDIGKFFLGEKHDSWQGFYKKSHELKWYNLIIPFWNIHILIDYPWHDQKKGGWKKEFYYVEIILWTIFIGVMLIIFL